MPLPLIELTGLWLGRTKDGRTYYSANLGKRIRLVLFENTRKKKENEPDATLFITLQKTSAHDVRGKAGDPAGSTLADGVDDHHAGN